MKLEEEDDLLLDFSGDIYLPLSLPMWDMDSDTCRHCQEDFGLLRREHHCRLCGAKVCADCSSNWVSLPFVSDPVRSCDPCLVSSEWASEQQAIHCATSERWSCDPVSDSTIRDWMMLLWRRSQGDPDSSLEIRRRLEQGLPPCLRATLWPLLASSEATLSLPSPSALARQCDASFVQRVEHDASRLPSLSPSLLSRSVLVCCAMQQLMLPYSQGLVPLSALLSRYMRPPSSLLFLRHLLLRLLRPLLLSPRPSWHAPFDLTLSSRLPLLYNRLSDAGLCPSLLAHSWLSSSLSACLPPHAAARLPDLLLARGSPILLSACAALLRLSSSSLLACPDDTHLLPLLNKIPEIALKNAGSSNALIQAFLAEEPIPP